MLAKILLVPVTVSLFLSFSNTVSAVGTDEFVSRGGYAFIRPRFIDFFRLSSVCLSSQRFHTTSFSKGTKFILPSIPQHLLEKDQTVKHSKRIFLKGQRHYNSTDDLFYYELGKSQKKKIKPLDQAKSREFGLKSYKILSAARQQKKLTQADAERTDEKLVSKKSYGLVKKLSHTSFDDLPYASVGRVLGFFDYQGKQSVGLGSATAVNRNIVLSAAHNFMPRELHGAPNIMKIRAHEALFQHRYPNPAISHGFPAKFKLHPRWVSSFDSSFDIAVVCLENLLGDSEYVVPHIAKKALKREKVLISGYPAEVPNIDDSEQGEQMYVSEGVVLSDNGTLLSYDANTFSGNSGGSVVVRNTKGMLGEKMVGIHTTGGMAYNSGVRFRRELAQFVSESVDEFYRTNPFKQDFSDEDILEVIKTEFSSLKVTPFLLKKLRLMRTYDRIKAALDFMQLDKLRRK